jgi:hypothetical protein
MNRKNIMARLYLMVLFLTIFDLKFLSIAYAQNEVYRYQLEKGKDNDLCPHMTEVFNQYFKTPWKRGYLGLDPDPFTQGTPLDHVFERLPGVEYDQRATWEMLYSKYPTAPEFEAVHWQEGRQCSPSPDKDCPPMLITKLDIDNDGNQDWVIKFTFMQDIYTWESQ